jgi:predicted alpha/beta-fold hydrolase
MVATAPRPALADAQNFEAVVASIEALPYQPDYVPSGFDSAFPAGTVLNTAPAQDYTTGSIPGSPDSPSWPPAFQPVRFQSADGATLLGEMALQPGNRPGIVVVHGFNTHGMTSVIRWAAMLAANGYNVLAADQRDFFWEQQANVDSTYPQTFGWKESQDVLAAGRFLAAQPGVSSMGIVGFSEGAQNTVLALAQDSDHLFRAGLTFSAPADQDTQIYSTAQPPGCQTPLCTYPVTDALVALVVPHEATVCSAITDAATAYGTTGFQLLANETAMHAQAAIQVPLLNFYSNDDPLVQPFQASMMASYEGGRQDQRTILIQRGNHAYYYDRWWQQQAILAYFKALLGDTSEVGAVPTVNQTAGGLALGSQEVALGSPSPSWGDAQLAPYVCDTTQGAPGRQSIP